MLNESLSRQAIINSINNDAIKFFNNLRLSSDWSLISDTFISNLNRAVLFMMVKNEGDIIFYNLEHHYRLGFRRFFVLNNLSKDHTENELKQFSDLYPDIQFFCKNDLQCGVSPAKKMLDLQEIFIKKFYDVPGFPEPEWAFFIDADEFLTCAVKQHDDAIQQFNQQLANPDIKLLATHQICCASKRINEFSETGNPFKLYPHVSTHLNPLNFKSAYRLQHNFEIQNGNQFVKDFPYQIDNIGVMAETGFFLFHFPLRSLEQYRRKLIHNYYAHRRIHLENDFMTFWQQLYNNFEKNGDRFLVELFEKYINDCR